MKLPRDVYGADLVKYLVRHWDYQVSIQHGSHVILVTEHPRHHRMPVPNHKPIGIGMLRAIVSEVCEVKGIDRETFLLGL